MDPRPAVAALAALGTLTGGAFVAPFAGASTPHAAPTTAGHPAVRVIGDCVHAQREPDQVIIACGDDGVFFRIARYTSWTADRATAQGTLWMNTDHGAATGRYVHFSASIVMDRPKRVAHQLRYSRIVAQYSGSNGRKHTQSFHPPVRG